MKARQRYGPRFICLNPTAKHELGIQFGAAKQRPKCPRCGSQVIARLTFPAPDKPTESTEEFMLKRTEKTQEQIMSEYARGLRESAKNWLEISDAILEDREMARFALRMAVDNHNAAQKVEGVFVPKGEAA